MFLLLGSWGHARESHEDQLQDGGGQALIEEEADLKQVGKGTWERRGGGGGEGVGGRRRRRREEEEEEEEEEGREEQEEEEEQEEGEK